MGWLNLEPNVDSGSGVEVGDFELTGYIWGENIGWINFAPNAIGVKTSWRSDQDGDGVPDNVDACPDEDASGFDADGDVDVTDAVLGLQMLAGVGSKNVKITADLSSAGKIGMEEVIYILQLC